MTSADTPEPDRELVEAILAGRAGSFERLVGRYQGLCWHIVLRMVRDREDAQDVLQDSFLRIYRNLHQFRYQSALQTWVAQVSYSVAVRYLERKRIPLERYASDAKRQSALEAIPDGADVEASSADDQMVGMLLASMKDLPPVQRTLLTLYHLDELPIAEIATITNLNESTIKSHLFRARKWLRSRLAPHTGASS